MTQITVKRLWKEYDTQVVLENVNLEVGDHEFVTIVGASGCGKTTFLRMLLGVETPTRGEFLLDGQPLPPEPGPDRGIVFQRYSLFPHLTVLDNLLLGLELRGAPRAWKAVRCAAARSDRKGRWVARIRSGSVPRAANILRNSPGVCSSASPSHNRSSASPRYCCSTSPSVPWTPALRPICTS